MKGKEEGHKSRKQGILGGPDPWDSLNHPQVSLGLSTLIDHLGGYFSTLQLHNGSKGVRTISLGKEVKTKSHK